MNCVVGGGMLRFAFCYALVHCCGINFFWLWCLSFPPVKMCFGAWLSIMCFSLSFLDYVGLSFLICTCYFLGKIINWMRRYVGGYLMAE